MFLFTVTFCANPANNLTCPPSSISISIIPATKALSHALARSGAELAAGVRTLHAETQDALGKIKWHRLRNFCVYFEGAASGGGGSGGPGSGGSSGGSSGTAGLRAGSSDSVLSVSHGTVGVTKREVGIGIKKSGKRSGNKETNHWLVAQTLRRLGATLAPLITSEVTHVVVDLKRDDASPSALARVAALRAALTELRCTPPTRVEPRVVTLQWAKACVEESKRIALDSHEAEAMYAFDLNDERRRSVASCGAQ